MCRRRKNQTSIRSDLKSFQKRLSFALRYFDQPKYVELLRNSTHTVDCRVLFNVSEISRIDVKCAHVGMRARNEFNGMQTLNGSCLLCLDTHTDSFRSRGDSDGNVSKGREQKGKDCSLMQIYRKSNFWCGGYFWIIGHWFESGCPF